MSREFHVNLSTLEQLYHDVPLAWLFIDDSNLKRKFYELDDEIRAGLVHAGERRRAAEVQREANRERRREADERKAQEKLARDAEKAERLRLSEQR